LRARALRMKFTNLPQVMKVRSAAPERGHSCPPRRLLPPLLAFLWFATALVLPAEDTNRTKLWFDRDAKFYRETGTHVRELTQLTSKHLDALAEYDSVKGMPIDEHSMARIYEKAGNNHHAFGIVAKLISMKSIDNAYSLEMARVRDGMIDKRLLKIAAEKNWRIARSDSGNQTSGMKSDLDQTFYVFEYDEKTKTYKRASLEADAELVRLFEQRWTDGPGKALIPLSALDIASIMGANRFPDPRDVTIENYHVEYERVIRALRKTPGAYTTAGAVAQQMQFRAFNEIMARNPRAYRIYGKDAKGEYSKFPSEDFDKMEPEARMKELAKIGSDWHEEAVRTMFGQEPQLMRGYAFGAAMANFQEMQKYMGEAKFETKYHLRTWEDGMLVEHLASEGEASGVARSQKKEYGSLSSAEREALNRKFMEKLFPGDETKQKQHSLALEISLAQRELHKGKKPPGFQDTSNKTQENQLLFGKLAESLGIKNFDAANPDHLDRVDKAYRNMASEFSMASTHHCAPEAFEMLIKDSEGAKRFVEGYEHLMERTQGRQLQGETFTDANGKQVTLTAEQVKERFTRNLADASKLTLIYALYDLGKMGEEHATRLTRTLRERFPDHGHIVDELVREAERLSHDPEAELLRPHGDGHAPEPKAGYKEVLTRRFWELSSRVGDHVMGELGIHRRGEAQVVNSILRRQELVWDWRKLGKERAMDAGTYDSLAQILLVAVQSDLDIGEITHAAGRELFFNLPIAGQVAGAADGGVVGITLIGAGMYYPPFGHVMVAYSIGSAGYEIYSLEVTAPRATNLEDAMYRGFLGPDLRDYGEVPLDISDEERRQLGEMESKLSMAQARYAMMKQRMAMSGPMVPYAPEAIEYGRLQTEAEILLRDLGPKIEELRRKEALFKSYRDDRSVWAWQGGRFFGWVSDRLGGSGVGPGAQPVQKPFANYLLREVPPLFGFFPQEEGAVDFTILTNYNPEAVTAEAAKLSAKSQNETLDLRERFLAAAQLHELTVVQSNRYERAKRYLEASSKSPELSYRIKRDSVYPWMVWAGVPSVQQYVENWCRAKDEDVSEEAIANQLVDETVWEARGGYGRGRYVRNSKIAIGSIGPLTERLRSDLDRSRDLWVEYVNREKARIKRSLQENVDEAVRRFKAEAAGQTAINQQDNEVYQDMLQTMRLACIRPNAPSLSAQLILTPTNSGKVRLSTGASEAADQEYEISVQTRLTANPHYYFGDPEKTNGYTMAVRYLNEAETRASVSSRKVTEVPLRPGTVKALEHVLAAPRPVNDKDELLVAVVTAFSKKMIRLDRLNPAVPGLREAVEHLPGVAADEQVQGLGHVMAQAVCYGLVPRGTTGAYTSEEVRSGADTFFVNIVITDRRVNPPYVTRLRSMITVQEGMTKEQAFAKRIQQTKEKYPDREVTIEERK